MRIAIVTGASGGLGKEFVLQIDARERVEQIWVIARHEDQLRALSAQVQTPVRALALDLTKDEAFTALGAPLEAETLDIRLLVNNAGIGYMGTYADIQSAGNDGMIDLNCKALVRLTTLCLPYMGRGSRVLQIASSASFQPLPGLNVYAATKAFVLRYSRALWWEVWGRGIHVTAACPYWIKDTGFIPNARNAGQRPAIRHFPLASRPRSVARMALLGSRWNLQVTCCGPISWVQRICAKFLPHLLIDAAWEGIRRL